MMMVKTSARLRLCVIALAAGVLANLGLGSAFAQTGGRPAAEPPAIAPAKPDKGPPAAVKLPAALPQDVAFARFIALIRGHLLTGVELVAQRQWDAARPHFSFPLEEVYGIIREDLRTYKTPPFDAALKALVRTVQARSAKQYPIALKKVETALSAADAGLKARQPNWPRFMATVAAEVLKTAPDEYDDAVINGRIVRPIGYQTARGLILQADRMIESVANELAGANGAALAEIQAALEPLKRAFAPVAVPKQAVISSAALADSIARVETAARLIN